MATLIGVKKRISTRMWRLRKKINKIRYKDISGGKTGISILSCNCIGGIVMSELNMEFTSPTINCFMPMDDFVSFCENLDYYLDSTLEEIDNALHGVQYPVVMLGKKLVIHCVHYKSSNEFIKKWEERKKRLNRQKLFLIFAERDGFEPSLLNRIDELPYKKVLFARQSDPNRDYVFKIEGFEKQSCLDDITQFKGITGKRLYSKYDFVKTIRDMKGA